ncbi:MAG: hypothetical protein C0392_07760 [Syntrophus sp. (in: bacteria)]|nr:hypothetical protein [Syntrophus sp. (in: bacteria)]
MKEISYVFNPAYLKISSRLYRRIWPFVLTLLLFGMLFYAVTPTLVMAAEPPEYLQANINAQAHAADPTGWVLPGLKTITAPGDGNTWSAGKVMVRAFTNPKFYNLTNKKFQDLSAGALWVTTGNELPAWYRNPANGVNAGNIALKTAQLHGLPTSVLTQYNAVVEMWVNPDKVIRPTRDPNRGAQPTALPTQDFATKPAYMSDNDYTKFKTWYSGNITSSYGNTDPGKQYPWTQLGYTYNWGNDQSSLASVAGLSEFVLLGGWTGVTSPLETFAVYSIQSYIYKTGTDGDGSGNFNVTGNVDTIWAGTKFQPTGNTIIIGQNGVVSGGEGIYVSSAGYTVTNSGSILGPTNQKYYGDGPAGTSIYFYDGGTLVNSASGVISGNNIAIGNRPAAAGGVTVTNYGYLSGSQYAMQTGTANDSLIVESGGIVRGSVDLGTGADNILFKTGAEYRTIIDRQNGTASLLNAANIIVQNGAAVTPEIGSTGVIPSGAAYRIAQGTAVTGTFGTIVDNYPLFDFSLLSTNTDLSLKVTRIPYAIVAGTVDPKLTAFAGILDGGVATASGDMAFLMSEIDRQNSNNSVAEAVRQLSPVVHSATPSATFATDGMRLKQLLARNNVNGDAKASASLMPVRYAAASPTNDAAPIYKSPGQGFWEGFVLTAGYKGSQDTVDNTPGYKYDAWSFLAGLEKRFTSGATTGFSLSTSQAYISGRDIGSSKARIDAISPAFFAGASFDRLRINVVTEYSFNQYHSDRGIAFGNVNRTAKSDHNGNQLSGMLDMGYRIKLAERTILEPVGGFYLSYLDEDGFRETGADAANLTVDSRTNWAFISHLGSKLRQDFRYANINMNIELAALWLHNFNQGSDVTARLSYLSNSASIRGTDSDRDAVELRARLSLYKDRGFNASLDYTLIVSPNSQENSAQLGFKWVF